METEVMRGPRPNVDLGRYRADLADLSLSDDQERELLETLWNIMSSFVEMGFTVDVCGLLFDDVNDAADGESRRVTLPSSPSMEMPSDGSGEDGIK